MIEETPFVFVYGTLKKGFSNHYLLFDAEFVGEGYTIEKFDLFTDEYPIAVEGGKYHILGEIYKIKHIETFKKLDLLEGYPDFYDRKITQIFSKGKIYNAWIYFMPENRFYSLGLDKTFKKLNSNNNFLSWKNSFQRSK